MPAAARRETTPSPCEAVLHEVLGAVFAPSQRDTILHDALETAGLEDVPVLPTALRVFVEGALFTSLARWVGVDDAIELVRQTRGALEVALASTASPRSDIRPRPQFVRPESVLVASHASLVVFLLQDVLGSSVEVVGAASLASLRREIALRSGRPLLVIVDRRHPCVDVSAVEVFESLGEDSVVVWWSAMLAEQAKVRESLSSRVRLLVRDTDARLGDLGELCATLVAGGG
ncbi:MAG: hypothetical protein IT378_09860 [Sandaracinaceae bacterium]|nr:hypothetical protein [Sandaracinaceae bacterium]